ncbi:MAG: NTP transferase domain-containing protein [Bacilli bacterium]|nr:NTP transferase domain-containing protein [Bacilli bacterium]
MDKYVIVLAAGKGTSMNSIDPETSKVAYPILGKPIINYVLDAIKPLEPKKTVVVVGFGGETTKSLVEKEADVVWQKDILGTGHAVLQTRKLLEGREGQTLIIYGDTPLVATETIENVFHRHNSRGNDMTVVSAVLENPKGYGRVIREHKSNKILEIIEETDCPEDLTYMNEVNTGICVINNDVLWKYIDKLSKDNARHFYYLSELVKILVSDGLQVDTFVAADRSEVFGINNRVQLAYAAKVMRKRINNRLMLSGVSIEDPDTSYISPDVEIGRDTIILPNTTILGPSKIGEGNTIGPNSNLQRVIIGNNNQIYGSTISDSTITDNSIIGPYTILSNENMGQKENK